MIKDTGHFTIKEQYGNKSQQWKVASWVINGTQLRIKKLNKKLVEIFKHLYAFTQILSSSPGMGESNDQEENDDQEVDGSCCCFPNVQAGLTNIKNSIYWIAMAFLGLPYYITPKIEYSDIEAEIEYDRNKEFLRKFGNNHNFQLFTYVIKNGTNFLQEINKLASVELQKQISERGSAIQNKPQNDKASKYQILFTTIENYFAQNDASP